MLIIKILLNRINFIYTSVGICLLTITVSCNTKISPNKPDKSESTNNTKELRLAPILLSSNKTNLSGDKKIFQILLDNQTETPVNLAEYKLRISLQEDGPSGSTLHYKDASDQSHDQSKIEQNLLHFVKQTTLKKGENTIRLSFEIKNVAGATKITITVALEHTDNGNNVPPIKIIWEDLTPITDEMIREAQANNYEILAKKLTKLKEEKKPLELNDEERDKLIRELIEDMDIYNVASEQAVRLGNINIVKVLLERGEEFNTSISIETPLGLAIKENRVDIAKLIIDKLDRKELSQKDICGFTLIHEAISNDNTEIAKILIEKLDIVELSYKEELFHRTPIEIAVKHGNTEIFLLLLKKLDKLDQEVLEALGKQNKKGNTYLHSAIEKGNTEIAIALIERLDASKLNVGKHIDYTEYDPWFGGLTIFVGKGRLTPLHLAMREDNIAVVNALIEKLNVAQLNEWNVEGKAALHLAAGRNHFEIVKSLLSKGVDKTIKDKDGYTALDLTTDQAIKKLLKV